MKARQLVLDTNVLVAGLRSSQGASFRLLSMIGRTQAFEINLSVPLVLEYEDVLRRRQPLPHLEEADVDRVLDFLCRVGNHREIYFLWRPVLRDPSDDMVLELAVESGSDTIVTHNVSDFAGAETFGIQVETPRQFLERIGEST